MSKLVETLRADQDAAQVRMTEILEAVSASEETRSLTDEEKADFDQAEARFDALKVEIERAERHAERETARLAREADAKAAIERAGTASPAVVTREDGPYTPASAANRGNSYFRDLWRAQKGDAASLERLNRNNQHAAAYRSNVGNTTVNGAGGEFVPPLWLEQDFVSLARPGRITADLCQKDRLPEGTDSINIPKMTGATAVGNQGTQNTAITGQDVTTTSISSGVFTVAGGNTVSLQLVQQSPLNIDKIIAQDLAKSYAIQLDNWVIQGTGSNQPQGLLTLPGRSADITGYDTGGTDSPKSFYAGVANQISAIQTARYESPTHIVMHPRRWYWLVQQLDSSNRPLVVPSGPGFNQMASGDQLNNTQGIVGHMLGLPVVVDPNLPTNLVDGKGTPANDADTVIVAKFDDLWLWEGDVRTEAFEQTYANNLSLFIRLYNFVSFQPARHPESVGLVTKNV